MRCAGLPSFTYPLGTPHDGIEAEGRSTAVGSLRVKRILPDDVHPEKVELVVIFLILEEILLS